MNSVKALIILSILALSQATTGQTPGVSWEKWNFLIGEWVGEGSGQPGQGEGKFSFSTDLDGKILVRKSRTVFPAAQNSPAQVHDDLLIVYPSTGDQQEAIYFDNEGHVIRYKVTFSGQTILLTSDATAGSPRFRLSYVPIDGKTVNVVLEMSSPQDPETFRTYLSGKSLKVK